jgi:hypothetical protein
VKRIKIKASEDDSSLADCERIVRVLAANGYEASIDQARVLWEMHSEMFAAGWLFLPESDHALFADVRPYFDEVEES